MSDAVAFFLTIGTYGTWLPGDQRGWTDYHRGWKMPNRVVEIEAAAIMSEHAKILNSVQRELVEQQVRDTCAYRGWVCHAVNCRSNHMHVVISAPNTHPKKVRSDVKAWCTRKLKESSSMSDSKNWWAERGSIRWVLDEESLKRVIYYTLEEQDAER